MSSHPFQALRHSLFLHISQHFSLSDRCWADKETFQFFLEEAKKGKGKENIPSPIIVKAPTTSKVSSITSNKQIKPQVNETKPTVKEEAPATIIGKAPSTISVEKEKPTKNASLPPKSFRLSKNFLLEPLPPFNPPSFTELHKWVTQLFPYFSFRANPIENKDQNPFSVLIVVDKESKEQHSFLQTVAQGITDRLAPATVLSLQEALLSNTKEIKLFLITPKAHSNFIPPSPAPHLLLENLNNYLNNPSLKRHLWNQIRAHLSQQPKL